MFEKQENQITGAIGYIFIMAILATLLLASCGAKDEGSITVTTGAQARDLVGFERSTYEANKVESKADCYGRTSEYGGWYFRWCSL